MIAYGCPIASERKYRRYAQAGIRRVSDPDTQVIELRDQSCIFRAYNEILARVTGDPEVEALVLVHEDTEIREERFEQKARAALADERVAIAGSIGAVGVYDIDWWVHERLVGSVTLNVLRPLDTYATSLLPRRERLVGERGAGEVDMVDGFLLILSPWAIENLRFDERLGPGFHGYDADLCYQARELGKKVVVVDLDVAHHQNTLVPGDARDQWKRAHAGFRRKWERRWPLPLPPWAP